MSTPRWLAVAYLRFVFWLHKRRRRRHFKIAMASVKATQWARRELWNSYGVDVDGTYTDEEETDG